MSNAITTHQQPAFPARQALTGINAGAVTIESERAIAEAKSRLAMAKYYPRDETRAYQRVIEACSRHSLAESAIYAYPRAGQTVTGPSIRLAEELLGAALHHVEVQRHAAARIEHHDGGDRRWLVVEVGERLQLSVVVDLEIFLDEIRDEAPFVVGDGRVDRDRLRRNLDLRAGARGQENGRRGDRNR